MPSASHGSLFSSHASSYARSAGHAGGEDLKLLLELLDPVGGGPVLDVATGTGFTAMALSGGTNEVHASDITPEMLGEARKLAREKGLRGLAFELAAAESLPFRDRSFDAVTCRRAAHHFRDVGLFLAESARVLRAGGKIGVADMSPIDGAEAFVNGIETIRDGTHVRALTAKEWLRRFGEVGLDVTASATVSAYVDFDTWLAPVPPGGAADSKIRAEFGRLPGELEARLGVKSDGGRVRGCVRTWAVVVGTKR